MNKYHVIFTMLAGNRLETVLTAESIQSLNERITQPAGPLMTFYDEVDPDHNTFVINLANVASIHYKLLAKQPKKEN